MPVVISSSASSRNSFLGGVTTGSVSSTIYADPNATGLVVIAGLLWMGQVDATAATFGVTFGGTAMENVANLEWDSSHVKFKAYTLEAPPTGSKTVTASFSGLAIDTDRSYLVLVVATYSGAETIGTPVTATGLATENSAVTVPSVSAAHRVVTLHAVGSDLTVYENKFDSYSLTTRAHLQTGNTYNIYLAGDLLLGDADGSASVISSAHPWKSKSVGWGAIGMTLSPAVVTGDASLQLTGLEIRGNGGTFRVATPAPDRYYEMPALTGP